MMNSKEYFDKVAKQWDDMRSQFFSEAVREKAFSVAEAEPGELAADIGAGTGFITEGLLARGVRVIAVDQSQEMLSQMQFKFGTIPGFEYRLGTAEALPIEDGKLNYVFANMYLHHVEDPAASIKEMVRTLQAGGRLVITDLDQHEFKFLVEEQYDRWMGFKREDVGRWLSDAGLKEVQVGSVGEECQSASSGGEQASVSIFIASGIK
jgi:ubiquinone/menaquinone biosynthesis C-methylase UbiE